MTVLKYPTSTTSGHLRMQDKTCGTIEESSGPFKARFQLTLRQRCIMRDIMLFFDEVRLENLLVPILEQRYTVSLRALDWLVTNYAKRFNIAIYTASRLFNVHQEYKTSLSFFRRRNFDPFRRRMRITFVAKGGGEYETTIGQLNFIKWAQHNGVLDYASQHLHEIEDDMHQASKQQRETKRSLDPSRRRELSSAPSRRVSVYRVTQKVTF